MSKGPSVFLLQVNKPGSTNILQNGRYVAGDWRSRTKDKDHGEVKTGDLLLVYFAGQAIDFQKQLRQVYKVEDVLKNNWEYVLKHEHELNPITLDTIREKVKEGFLSEVFLKCGRIGFNICNIPYSEYQKVLQLSSGLPPTPPVIGAESLLEDFLVNNWRPAKFFGKEYSNLEILEDSSGGIIGQQYDTRGIGIIDLLCIDKRTGEYCVVELKRGPESSDDAVGQLTRYMGWVKANLAGGKKVNGIIVTGGHDEKLRYAASVIPNVHIAVYEMQFKISLASTT
jgi:hypothetical protein